MCFHYFTLGYVYFLCFFCSTSFPSFISWLWLCKSEINCAIFQFAIQHTMRVISCSRKYVVLLRNSTTFPLSLSSSRALQSLMVLTTIPKPSSLRPSTLNTYCTGFIVHQRTKTGVYTRGSRELARCTQMKKNIIIFWSFWLKLNIKLC